jgi:hypothetical protein
MTNDTIDFGAERERRKDERVIREIKQDEQEWNRVRDQLNALLLQSNLSEIGVTSVTLRALIDALTESGMSLENAKDKITSTVRLYY